MIDNTLHPSKRPFLSTAIFFLCCWYLLLCAVNYTRQRPLWLDEISVFKSVSTYQPQDFFTKKLAVDQIFPRFYLFLIQKISQPFDFSLLAVRFFSFVAMIAAFLVWFKVAGQELAPKASEARAKLEDNLQYFTFVLCWVASAPLVYYSAELKQYSMDVLASGLFVWFLYNQKSLAKNKAQYLTILTLLPLLGLFSYPAFLFFIFPVYNLLMEKPKEKGHWLALALFCVSALFAVAFVYFFDIRITKANVHTQGFMDYSVSFQSVGAFFKTFGEGTMNLFSRWFAERPRFIKRIAVFFLMCGLIYMVYGFFRSFRKNKYFNVADNLAFPIYIELFILGCLGKYPFSVTRTSLFFCPLIFIATIKGIAELKRIHPYLYKVAHALFLTFLTFVAIGIARVVLTQDFSFSPKIW